MKKIISLLAVITLTGCTANMVRHPNQAETNSQYAPESERQSNGIGVINYMTSGYDFAVEARKEDAYKQMFTACNGKYEIVDKDTWKSDPMYSAINGTIYSGSFNYKYLYFRCL